MASGTGWKWMLAALVAAGTGLSGACKDDDSSSPSVSGGAIATPLNWYSTAGGANGTAGANGITPMNWIDPNTPVNTGGTGVIVSQDERTYSQPDPYFDPAAIPPDPELPHPLSTRTSNGQITNPEDLLASFINAYRQQVLGVGAGGGLLGGGGFIGGVGQNVLLPMDEPMRRCARAYCKHIALYHPAVAPATPPSLTELNQTGTGTDGETSIAGGPMFGLGAARPGRLRKCKITYTAAEGGAISGQGYPDANSASAWFIGAANPPNVAAGWTHIGCGYWLGFSDGHYWNVICASNPAIMVP